MSSDEYRVKNVCRYSRNTFHDDQENEIFDHLDSTQLDGSAGHDQHCHCIITDHMIPITDGDISNISDLKCPVIDLAQQQLQRILGESQENCESFQQCKSVYDIATLLKSVLLMCKNKYYGAVILLFLFVTFSTGLIMGAATCGFDNGEFNSPILACINNRFKDDEYFLSENMYRSIV